MIWVYKDSYTEDEEDIALTEANSLENAVAQFRALYKNASKENIEAADWNQLGIAVIR